MIEIQHASMPVQSFESLNKFKGVYMIKTTRHFSNILNVPNVPWYMTSSNILSSCLIFNHQTRNISSGQLFFLLLCKNMDESILLISNCSRIILVLLHSCFKMYIYVYFFLSYILCCKYNCINALRKEKTYLYWKHHYCYSTVACETWVH